MSQPQSTERIRADVKRITRLLSRRPPEGKRRIHLLRERERLEASLYDDGEEGEPMRREDDEATEPDFSLIERMAEEALAEDDAGLTEDLDEWLDAPGDALPKPAGLYDHELSEEAGRELERILDHEAGQPTRPARDLPEGGVDDLKR